MLRQVDKPVFFAVNKTDGPEREDALFEFYGLGVEPLYPLSAEHGYGVSDLLTALVAALPRKKVSKVDEKAVRVAVVGRPRPWIELGWRFDYTDGSTTSPSNFVMQSPRPVHDVHLRLSLPEGLPWVAQRIWPIPVVPSISTD
jgi:hypothetical protein